MKLKKYDYLIVEAGLFESVFSHEAKRLENGATTAAIIPGQGVAFAFGRVLFICRLAE